MEEMTETKPKPIATYTAFCTDCRQSKRADQMLQVKSADGKSYRTRCTACDYRARAPKVSA